MDLSRIPPQAKGARHQHFRETLDSEALGLEVGIMSVPGNVVVEGGLDYVDDELILTAEVRGTKRFGCSRCLEEFERPFAKEIELHFELESEPVNAIPELGEEIMVDAPINILCREGCRGLCDRCGANLNMGPCGCRREPESPSPHPGG